MKNTIVRISTPLRQLTGGADEVEVTGRTVGQVLETLGAEHDGLLDRLLDKDGRVRPFVNIYLGENNVKTLNGMDTDVDDGDVINIVLAVAGG